MNTALSLVYFTIALQLSQLSVRCLVLAAPFPRFPNRFEGFFRMQLGLTRSTYWLQCPGGWLGTFTYDLTDLKMKLVYDCAQTGNRREFYFNYQNRAETLYIVDSRCLSNETDVSELHQFGGANAAPSRNLNCVINRCVNYDLTHQEFSTMPRPEALYYAIDAIYSTNEVFNADTMRPELVHSLRCRLNSRDFLIDIKANGDLVRISNGMTSWKFDGFLNRDSLDGVKYYQLDEFKAMRNPQYACSFAGALFPGKNVD